MTILISGSSGFLGSKLVNELKRNFYKFYIISNEKKNKEYFINIKNVNKKSTIKKYKNKISVVIHLATKYDYNNIDAKKIYDANFFYSLKILNFSKNIKAKLFLNICTTLNKDTNLYSFSKYHFKKFLIMNNLRFEKLKIVNCYFDMMFGYNDKRFFDNLIKRLVYTNDSIDLTRCNQIRNIICADELVKQFLSILKNHNKLKEGELKLGAEYDLKLKTFIKLITFRLEEKYNKKFFRRLNFGKIPNRKNERIFKNYRCESQFNKYKNKYFYLKNMQKTLNFEIEKYK